MLGGLLCELCGGWCARQSLQCRFTLLHSASLHNFVFNIAVCVCVYPRPYPAVAELLGGEVPAMADGIARDLAPNWAVNLGERALPGAPGPLRANLEEVGLPL